MNLQDIPKETKVSLDPELERHVPNDGPHVVTLNQPSQKKGKSHNKPDISTSFHFTVNIPNKSLTRRHYRLLLETLLYEVIKSGIDLYQYMMIEHLMSLILGKKLNYLELGNEHERRLVSLSMSILRSLRNLSFEPDLKQRSLSKDIVEFILNNNLIMSERVYQSRKNYYLAQYYLEIKTVAVETIYERSGKSERYSSYCKGYGESHASSHYKKTQPSAELDGEEPVPKEITLKELQVLFSLTQLDLKTENLKRKS